MRNRKGIKYLFIILFILFAVLSCQNRVDTYPDLESALTAGGNNRKELEKVLEYFSRNSKDSLKLEAAEFLIRNMIYHYSISGDYMDSHIQKVDSVYSYLPSAIRSMIYCVPARINENKSKIAIEYDIVNVKADFLINNIEKSFEMWMNHSYVSRLSKDVFFEYILPYRLSYEPLINWKDSSMYNYFNINRIDDSEFGLYEYGKCIETRTELLSFFDLKQFPDETLQYFSPDCIEQAYYIVKTLRSLGVPAAVDFVPHYPTKDNRHYWFVTIDERYFHNTVTLFNDPYAAKVYRKSYSLNPIPHDKFNFIPEYLNDPYNKDVTEVYEKVSNVKYDYGDVPKTVKYGYLSVFNSLTWKEVAWAKIKNGKAEFEKMGCEIIYMPTYYNGNNQVCGKYPLLMDAFGNTREIIPNKKVTQNVLLNRKFPTHSGSVVRAKSLLALKIEATNNSKMNTLDSLAVIDNFRIMQYDTVRIQSEMKYKYWVISNPKFEYADIADLIFIDKSGKIVDGIYFSMDANGNYIENDANVAGMFDGDILTSSYLIKKVGVRFANPTALSGIKYISRNDGNVICPDNEYELFYFDEGNWVSLGRKIPTDHFLSYENIPTDALFWLRNLTSGVEERPFTIKNGKVRFW